MNTINPQVFIGCPINFKDICKVYPPKVKDVIDNDNYYSYQSLFTISNEELEDAFINESISIPSPFEYLLANYLLDKEMRTIILDSFEYFIHESVTVVPEMEMIVVGVDEEHLNPDVDLVNPRLITKDNYFDFQNIVRESIGFEQIEPPVEDENPIVKKIKAKARLRDKIKAKHQSGLNLGTMLTAICCMGVGLTPLNIGEISYACVGWLIQMRGQMDSYDADLRAVFSFAGSTKNPTYWIKNFEDK